MNEDLPVYSPDLLEAVEAPHHDLFRLVSLLLPTAGNVALQFRICQRISQFPLEEIAFWLPQLVHVFVTVETDSVALEDMLIYLSQQNTHFALSVFWFTQASLSDLRPDPHSFGFSAAKRLANKLQHMLFAGGELPPEHMHENTEPAMVLGGLLAGVVGCPHLARQMKPLVESQGKKQRSSYLVRVVDKLRGTRTTPEPSSDGEVGLAQLGLVQMGSQPNLTFRNAQKSTESLSVVPTRSMPELRRGDMPGNLLKSNYFRCETQFVYALISISNRLLQVPKEARQSALQVELALLNEDLPHAMVDLPMLVQQRGDKQNRIVRICVNEATVLNSAEKAPFLMLVEYLRGDLTFDPLSTSNREVLRSSRVVTHIFERPSLQSHTHIPQPIQKSVEVDMTEIDISDVTLLEREELLSKPSQNLPVSSLELDGATNIREKQQFSEGPSAADLATQLRAASVILAQLEANTKLPRHQAQIIKERVLESMQQMKTQPSTKAGEAGERRLENDLKLSGLQVGDEKPLAADDDPSAANLGEDWQARRSRIRRSSQYGHLPNWDLVSVIVKTGDDLRQEALASQLIQRAAQLWKQHGVGVWVRRMMILITSANSGLVETITNALSLHSIKKALTTAEVNARTRDARTIAQLKQHFQLKFGPENSVRHAQAVKNFVTSLSGYSVLCYLLQIKDRHNGNILVDAEGHIIHIDFGFMLSNSPGHIGFEANTFKLTQEYIDLMGGNTSPNYELFVELSTAAFLALRHHTDELCSFMEIMGANSTLPCFKGGAQVTAQNLRLRLMPDLSEKEAAEQFELLIKKSENNLYTRLYDQYQLITQGIYS